MAENTVCSNIVDYSEVAGDRILPFRFVLNLEDSILNPEAGENQKFCYDVEGVGEDSSLYADLSHFLLGICAEIEPSDIEEITVTINGVPQNVVWGDNVEIKTAENPDNPTGCIGLKFDFPLNKVNGFMQVCITMASPYAIGPVNVCVFGGNTTVSGMSICGPACGDAPSCTNTFYQNETVCVPVTVTPFATSGTARATCCGEPVITPGGECPANQDSCTFTVTQSLCIEIPIEFGAVIETGSASVQCGTVSETECDCSAGTQPMISNEHHSRTRNDLRERHFRR